METSESGGAAVRWTPLPKAEAPTEPAGETRHYEFLKQNRPSTVSVMRMNGTLEWYLKEVNQEATEMLETLILQYAKAEGVENLSKVGNKVDCILTHCAPNSIQDIFSRGLYEHDALTDYLETIKQSCDFKLWFFGHYHENEMIGQKFVMLYGMIVPLSDFLKQDLGYESQYH